MMNLIQIKEKLIDVENNYDTIDEVQLFSELKQLKQFAIVDNDQQLCKEIWCYEAILKAQMGFVNVFQKLKCGEYYEGWTLLEQVESIVYSLERHFREHFDTYKLDYIKIYTERFQSVFPYKIFFSPEYIAETKLCSVCRKPVSIRNSCGHRVGEIYNGELCHRIITKATMLGISVVTNPVQKYSVAFMSDSETGKSRDHYDYKLVKYVVDRLESPFHGWNVEWTKVRHPHFRYEHISQSDDCPCESGRLYKDCCLNESGVLRPHCNITFHKDFSDELKFIEYID